MLRRTFAATLVFLATFLVASSLAPNEAHAAGRGQPTDWNRFYYYPYVYYPHNFQRNTTSYDHMYYRYPQNRRIPVYNANWYNFYPSEKPYYKGHHFILDIF
ncbi:MAG: hypothetical protein IID46_00445 [Planctomycetes bacterium]|nr:hypothetical protein [Planctomycetota bacterium]